MEYITEEILDSVLDKLDGFEEENILEMVESYFGKQPFLMMHLMAYNEEFENVETKDDFVFLLLVTLECFYTLKNDIALISEEEIEKQEEYELAEITKIENLSDESEQMDAMMAFMPSEELLFSYIEDTLGMNDEELTEEQMNESDAGGVFGCMKLVSELLLKSINEGDVKTV